MVSLWWWGKKETSCGQIQFLFSWLAGFSVTHWLRELDFPGTGSSASHGRSRNHQHERIKVFEKNPLSPNFRFCRSPSSLPLLFSFPFLSFLAGYPPCLIQCPRRGSVAGGQGLRRPLPQALPGLQVAGCSAGGSELRRVLLPAKSQTSVTPAQQLTKIIILSNNIFNSWPSPFYYPLPLEQKRYCEHTLLEENTQSFFLRAS